MGLQLGYYKDEACDFGAFGKDCDSRIGCHVGWCWGAGKGEGGSLNIHADGRGTLLRGERCKHSKQSSIIVFKSRLPAALPRKYLWISKRISYCF